MLLYLADARSLRAVAVDDPRGVVWAYGDQTLWAYRLTGERLYRLPLGHGGKQGDEKDAALQVQPDTGSVWVGLHVRATEYTVGSMGPQAMPGALPPASAYTYAVELSVDEAVAASAAAVRFTQPVVFYVENFLDFPVGGIVPAGYHDRGRGVWVPSQNGRIVKILDGNGALDVDGDGAADEGAALTALGITEAERQRLATLYPPGQSLWRVPIPHFTPWDCNWPYSPPDGAVPPQQPAPQPNQILDDCCRQAGSIIESENQTLGEVLGLTGTSLRLHYRSDRTPGRRDAYTLRIPVTGANVPTGLKRIDLTIAVAGRLDVQSVPAAPNQTTTFTWDGQDAYGRTLQGVQPVTIRLGYVYDATYQEPAQFDQSFGAFSGVPMTGSPARQEITFWQELQSSVGPWDARAQGLGGWSLTPQHVYDLWGRTLYRGDGQRRSATALGPVITTVAGKRGTWGYTGDGGPASEAALLRPTDVAVGADGSLFIVDHGNLVVRRVGPDGIITTVAGSGSLDDSNDGGPATLAQFNGARAVAVGVDGSLYVAEKYNDIIRRVSSALPRFASGEFLIPAENGAEVYVIDERGRHLRTVDALTGALRYRFNDDGAGRLIQVVDGDGQTLTMERDGAGNPAAIVGPFGQRTTLRLDEHGYLASLTSPAGETPRLTYTADGLLTSLTNPNGNRYRFSYDPEGRLLRDEDPAGGFKALTRTETTDTFTVNLTSALGRTHTYTVERLAAGDTRRVNTDPQGLQGIIEHRMGGRQEVTSPDGTVTILGKGPDPRFGMLAPVTQALTVATPGGLTSTMTETRTVALANPLDLLSLTQLTDTVTVNGRASTTTYDAASRSLTTRTPAGRQHVSLLDAQGRALEDRIDGFEPLRFTYDALGRLATVAQGARTSHLGYDAQGRLASRTDPLGRSVSFGYDLAGRLLRQTLPDGREILYTYDANSNLTSITPPGRPSHALTYTPVDLEAAYVPPELDVGPTPTQYAYNLDRQLVQVIRPDGTTLDLGYDSAGRLSTVTFPQGQVGFGYHPSTGNLASITAPAGGTLTYDYDGSLLTSEAWSGRVQYTYDNDFRVIAQQLNGEVLATFQYDADGLLTQAGALTLSRDPRHGLLTGSALGQITDTWAYTSLGELDSYRARFSSTDILTVQYVRDALGRIVQKTETLDGQATPYTYAYDLAGRLTTVTRNGRPIATYAYDSNGNRVSYTSPDGTMTGTYDAQDRLTQYGLTAYTYTANGELQSKTTGGQTTTYTYDALGNLTAVTLPDGTQIEYVIDGRQRRIGKKINGALVQGFLYSGQLQPVAELDGNGAIAARFIYGSRGNVPDYLIKGGYTYRILTDHLGSPRLVVEIATGHIVQRLAYDAFGRVIFDDNPGFQPFGFAGGLYDPDTQLTRFGARDYDAETGRWTAKDPIRFLGGDPNLYGYVLNDPVNRVDFLGLTDIGAEAAYGETAGLFPQLVQGNNVYNPRIWDSSSYAELQLARQWIADVRERNAYTNRSRPRNLRNPIEQRIWQDCQRAAEAAENFDLPNDVKHFFLRQDGVGRQTPAWASNTRPYRSFGPFINVGGGDVPKGSATYIDFYRGIR